MLLCNLNTAVTHFSPLNSQAILFLFYQHYIETTKISKWQAKVLSKIRKGKEVDKKADSFPFTSCKMRENRDIE